MQHDQDIGALRRQVERAGDFVRWLRTEGDRLVDAAGFLGGPRWARRAAVIVRVAREGHDLAARQSELRALRGLLRLNPVNGDETGEAPRILSRHPDDPGALEVRLCAEALDRGVRTIEALRLAGIPCLKEAA